MLGPRNLPTAIQQFNYEHDLEKHHKKLDQIQHADRKKKGVDKESKELAKLYEMRERNLKFHNSEKSLAIEKGNELLLGKLVEISRKKKPSPFNTKNESSLPRTLNGPSRRREKDRIAQENEAFARRLLSQQPALNRKKFEGDYAKHTELVKQMQRLDVFTSPRKATKLPPLKNKKQQKLEETAEAENKQKEEKERLEKEAKEKLEKEENEKKEREAKELKDKEEREQREKEQKEKEENEKKEQEEFERNLQKQEEAKKKTEQDQQINQVENNTDRAVDNKDGKESIPASVTNRSAVEDQNN